MTRLAKATWYVLTLRCEEADRVRSLRHDSSRLRRRERVGEWLHALLCRSCRAARQQLDTLTRLVSANREQLAEGPQETLSGEARQAIAERLRREQEKNSP